MNILITCAHCLIINYRYGSLDRLSSEFYHMNHFDHVYHIKTYVLTQLFVVDLYPHVSGNQGQNQRNQGNQEQV